ncbi:MFS transporter [Lutispora saccharofermentans]|uniref:MFS transporter n=1 Tax=Lutispora saccharofermentans TaxID=3024236 RepID=A0ABT1NHR5_9FIRM|nr:MFS transporter [Lutispora saccharofermentans]MCQ1529698.1 MFS transporter [Lutispora saccharofermentans]
MNHTIIHSVTEKEMAVVQKFILAGMMIGSSAIGVVENARSNLLPTILTQLHALPFYSIVLVLAGASTAVVLPIAGKISDLIGYKRVFILGVLVYAIACTGCLCATAFFVYLLFTVLAACAFGFLFGVYRTIIVAISLPQVRAKRIAICTIIDNFSIWGGPFIGGLLCDFWNWRIIYAVVLIPLLTSATLVFRFLPESKHFSKTEKVDWQGMLLFAAFLFPLMLWLAMGGTQFAWWSFPGVTLPFTVTIVFLFLIKWEKKSKNPMVPLQLFKKPVYCSIFIMAILANMCEAANGYLLLYLQYLFARSATTAGLMLLPKGVPSTVIALLIGRYLSRYKKYTHALALSLLCSIIAYLLMAQLSMDFRESYFFIIMLFYGAGTSSLLAISMLLAQHYIEHSHLGVGTSFIIFAGPFGMAAGYAVGNIVISSFWKGEKNIAAGLAELLLPDQLIQLSKMGVLKDRSIFEEIRKTLPSEAYFLLDTTVAQIEQNFLHCLSILFYLFTFLALIALGITAYIRFCEKSSRCTMVD